MQFAQQIRCWANAIRPYKTGVGECNSPCKFFSYLCHMDHSALYAISPVDGRYSNKTEQLTAYFSEYGLIRYRVLVEVKYFLALCRIPLPELADFPIDAIPALDKIYLSFIEEDALKIKEIERTTNHDVKAVEYFLRDKWDELGIGKYKEFIHFGLTSQDVNNTAIPLSLKDGINDIIIPEIESVLTQIKVKAAGWAHIPMLARTHGQPASPTKLGKEFMVFAERIQKQLIGLNEKEFFGKFGGATGNFNAHHVAYPAVKWLDFADNFLAIDLGLTRNQYTTQIDHYDDLADIFDNLRRLNVIMIDFCRDIWMYISQDYFRQQIKAG
jgi:adenylosuccinate lyase